MSLVKYIFEGRLTADPELRTYGADNNSLVNINVASDIGFGDNKKTVYHRCTAFKKTADAINNNFKQGDQIFIVGSPTQNKKDDKVYYGVNIEEWSFGSKKSGASTGKTEPKGDAPDKNPFDDSEIPF